LGLWQSHIERILAGWVAELKVTMYRGLDVTGFTQDATGVDVTLSNGTTLRAQYLVGCDGGRSRIRKVARIEFPRWDPTRSSLVAEAEMTESPPLGIHQSPLGTYAFGRLEYDIVDGKVVYKDVGPIRVLAPERLEAASEGEPTLRDVSAALIAACGT